MKLNDIRLITRCEGHFCQVREQCHWYCVEEHPSQGLADYSQAPTFKPACAKESCRMYKEAEK